MLCSNCSNIVKPIAAVDIDGTLGDYHTHFLRFAEGYLASYHDSHYQYKGWPRFGEWFCEAFGVDMTEFRQVKLAYRQGGMKRNMPVFEGAAELVRKLKEADIEVWLTTTRPYLRHDMVDPDTRFWLRRNHIPYDGLLYDERKYKRLAELVDPGRVVAVLDDENEQCDAAAMAFNPGVPILRLNNFNHTEHCSFVHSLSEARTRILGRASMWKQEEQHAHA